VRRALEIGILAVAVAVLGAAAAVAHRRERQAELSPWPVAGNPGPRGLGALHAWLVETGRAPVLLEDPADRPPARSSLVLAAPRAELGPADVDALLAHAERGGLVVWATGPGGSQAWLERRLAVSLSAEPVAARPIGALAPHPLFAGLSLSAGGGSVSSSLPVAIAVAGSRAEDETGALRASALSVAHGRGEVLVLAGASLLENLRIAEGDNLALWSRVAARGRVVFDERFRAPRAGPVPPSSRGLAALVMQALAAALCLFWGVGRRLGAVRPPPSAGASRTAADYLASLAVLYRRARAEPELVRASFRRLRQEMHLRAGIPAALGDAEAAARLARGSPAAVEAYRRAAAVAAASASAGSAELLALSRAAADLSSALLRRHLRR
jgi:hypothetical protein